MLSPPPPFCRPRGQVGAKMVVLSDRVDAQSILQRCFAAAKRNAVADRCTVLGLSWLEFTPAIKALPAFDLVLGADVLYEERDFEDLIGTVVYMLRKVS